MANIKLNSLSFIQAAITRNELQTFISIEPIFKGHPEQLKCSHKGTETRNG